MAMYRVVADHLTHVRDTVKPFTEEREAVQYCRNMSGSISRWPLATQRLVAGEWVTLCRFQAGKLLDK